MKALRIFLIGLFVVGALAYLNIIIPQPQQTQARTYQEEKGFLAQEFPCASGKTNVIHIGDEETPDCKNGSISDVTSYKGGVNISLVNTNNWYRLHTTWGSYYCPELGDGSNGCNTAQKLTQGTVTLKPGDYVKVWADTRDDVQKSCGSIQEDLSWTADVSTDGGKTWQNNACGYGSISNPGADNSTATWCSTNVKCSSITPTPTVTPTPTTPPQYHYVCQSFACVRKDGPGDSTCTTAADVSPECSHLTCLNNSCERAPGPGENSCTTEGSSCGQIQHMACQDYACRLVPGPGQDTCTYNDDCLPPVSHLTVIKVVNNNHGGTKQPGDFPLYVNGTHVTTGTSNVEQPGDYTVAEDKQDGYHLVSISGDCDSNGHVHLNAGDNKTCVIENEDNGTNACTMPTCNTNISGCSYPYPDTTSCSCGPLVCITQTPSQPNITINVHQEQQQQQQQAVLGASVAPAVSSTQLPRTGSGTEILLTLLGLLPIGLKLRKFV